MTYNAPVVHQIVRLFIPIGNYYKNRIQEQTKNNIANASAIPALVRLVSHCKYAWHKFSMPNRGIQKFTASSHTFSNIRTPKTATSTDTTTDKIVMTLCALERLFHFCFMTLLSVCNQFFKQKTYSVLFRYYLKSASTSVQFSTIQIRFSLQNDSEASCGDTNKICSVPEISR